VVVVGSRFVKEKKVCWAMGLRRPADAARGNSSCSLSQCVITLRFVDSVAGVQFTRPVTE
jgi:hypothetical protein